MVSSVSMRENRVLTYYSVLVAVTLVFVTVSRVSGQKPVFACDAGSNGFGFCDTSLGVDARVADLVKRLSLGEKIGFLVNSAGNVSRLGIPKYEWWSEALHGVSYVGPGTKLRGLAGLTFWSPNINIFRDPRWGRGQETPGEDPLLSSKYAAGYVRGLQQTGGKDPNRLKVAACCKHYTAYDLDNWKGIDRYHFNAKVSKQDLDDTFQPPFKSCVMDGNVASVMCSYNQVNGKPTCADPDLLSGVIRGEWKLNGYIVSDCDSVDVLYTSQHYTKTPEEAAAKSILAGKHTEAAVKGGMVNEAAVDKAISNNFATLMRLGFFDGDPRKQQFGNLGPKDVCSQANQELAREAARQGIVLLKNSAGSLPLSNTAIKNLAVIGPNANVTKTMIGNYEGLAALVTTSYHQGCANVGCGTAQNNEAANVAAVADATVLVVGADQSIEAESRDRVDLNLPGQQQLLITTVARAAKGPVILVIMSGGGFDISFAKNDDKITSILWVGYPGEAGGAAIADVIFGHYNPSGRLPMTWYPQSYVEKVPMDNMNMRPDPTTGYPGRTYRFYTGETIYAFGDGLSYTQFHHHLVNAPKLVNIPLSEGHACRSSRCTSLDLDDSSYSCENLAFDVNLRVKNMGKRSGFQTVFLYSSPPSIHNSPNKHLLGFEKVFVQAQSESAVKFSVNVCKDLSLVDEVGTRKVALGHHLLHIGDLKHSLSLRV
ncbi:hypothetical protein F8388_010522 [Cannabis sativa]|uniref:Fibronectin type III-like domain-containing protein n=1 Tax=Cannabis sativa TaxID=3483 RepID=A0A7J6E1I7_CANSA|nr:hypothetical protein G4B88_022891 [Cannabis sativa]KAF4384924.1 hypothetical protein F8388_010522 [Cannabis sativa]